MKKAAFFRLPLTLTMLMGATVGAQSATQFKVFAPSNPSATPSGAAAIDNTGHVFANSYANRFENIGAFYFDSKSFGRLWDGTVADVNDLGDAVGYGPNQAGNSDSHAFLYKGGKAINLGKLVDGYSGSSATGINNAGQIIGLSYTLSGPAGFVYEAGKVKWLEFNNNPITARGISDTGYITGEAAYSYRGSQAYLYKDGSIVGLGTLGGMNAVGRAVNDSGVVVGGSTTQDGQYHAFLYANQRMVDIAPNSSAIGFSVATGVNSFGQAVGVALANDRNHQFAFYYSNGNTFNLNDLIDSASGWNLLEASGINDRGQISATGCNKSGCSALLLAPIPEPATILYSVLGLFVIAGVVSRKVKDS